MNVIQAIDLNADLGEGFANDAALMQIVTSANVACGWHAGDEATMRETVRLAVMHGVAIGAHPSLPDREGFGRTAVTRSPGDIYADVTAQVRTLGAIASEQGAALRYVKPHGALYNAAAADERTAVAICRAVRDHDAGVFVYGLAGSELVRAARSCGLRAVEEIFADRRYAGDGALLPRSSRRAVIDDCREAVAQVLSMVERGIGETVCVHGDTPGAVDFARAVCEELKRAGITVRAVR